MILRLSVTLAAAVCLIGCDKGTDSSSSVTVTNTPPAAPEAPASTETKGDPDMTTTESGLKYKVLKSGEGTVSPKETDTVTVHYHGTLLNGQIFDSSVKRGQPASFALNQVIPGWTEGVQLMKVGDKYRFEIPPLLAYGEAGRPGIPPNSTLVFEVELLGIK